MEVVTGIREVMATLDKLPTAMQKKILRPGLRRGAKVIKQQAEANIRSLVSEEATGFLASHLEIRTKKTRNRSEVGVKVQIEGKVLNPKNNQRAGLYGSVLEYGKEGQAPKPWLRPAQAAKAQEAIAALEDYARQKLNDAVEDARR